MIRSYSGSIRASLILAGVSATLIAPIAAYAQEGQVIGEIKVEGTKNTNEQVVLVAGGIKIGDPFHNEDLLKARKNIRDKGLYATVNSRLETTPDKKLRVVYEVIENPVIANVLITGNKSIPSRELTPLLTTKPNQVLNTNDVRTDVGRILDYYKERGYVAYVAEDVAVDPKTQVLTIPIIEAVVSSIKVEGNKKTRPYVILREFRLKPGSVYNTNVLTKDMRRVLNLGLFSNVGPAQTRPRYGTGKSRLDHPRCRAAHRTNRRHLRLFHTPAADGHSRTLGEQLSGTRPNCQYSVDGRRPCGAKLL